MGSASLPSFGALQVHLEHRMARTVKPKEPLKPTLNEAPAIVSGLVAEFGAHERYYLSASYQEAQVRKDFIDKFLIALGWDVNHDVQKNPFRQEVKVERNIQGAKAQRRADYALSVEPCVPAARRPAECPRQHETHHRADLVAK
jgi:hypothetical protein